jgi:iron-sulfur cluster assembly protein
MNNSTIVTNEKIVEITDKAKVHLVEIFKNDNSEKLEAVRIKIVGGGCSGLSYKIEFSNPQQQDYKITLDQGVMLVIDPKSAVYLTDVMLDFQDGLEGKGFVFSNPNAKNTCGCGESFSV